MLFSEDWVQIEKNGDLSLEKRRNTDVMIPSRCAIAPSASCNTACPFVKLRDDILRIRCQYHDIEMRIWEDLSTE